MCLLRGTSWIFICNLGATDPPVLHAHLYGRFLIQEDKLAVPGNLPQRNDRSEIEKRYAEKYFHFPSSLQRVNMPAVPLVCKIYSRLSSVI